MATSDRPSPCVHPSPVYNRDFFVLRLSITVNNLSTVIEESHPSPVLTCPESGLSVSLSDMAQQVSAVLAVHQISLCRALCDDHCPLYAIDFPPPVTADCVNSLLPAFANVCAAVSSKYFATLPDALVEYELYLCSPSKDEHTASKVTAINSGNVSQEVEAFLKSQVFSFSDLFSDQSDDQPSPTYESLIYLLPEASPTWFLLGSFLGVPQDRLLVIEKEHDRSPDECLVFMFMWLVDNKSITWRKVVSALCKVNLRNLARKVCEKQNIPFTEGTVEDSEIPTLETLSHVLSGASGKWLQLGACLGVPPENLQIILNQCQAQPSEFLTRMLIYLLSNSAVSWAKVVEALRKVGLEDLAKELGEKYGVELSGTAVEVPLPEQKAEEKMRKEVQEFQSELEGSVQETHKNVDHIIHVEYPALKEELQELKQRKQRIEQRLELERQQCSVLNAAKEVHSEEINELESKLEDVKRKLQEKEDRIRELYGKIRAIESDITEKETSISQLTEKLETTDKKYQEKSEQMANLAKRLSSKTAELVEKSSVLMTLQNSLLDSDKAIARKAEEQMRIDREYLKKAKEKSQAAYVEEIELQIDTESQLVTHLESENHQATEECSRLEAKVAAVEDDVRTREQSLTEEDDPDTLVEAQIEVTSLKIDVTDCQLDLAKARIKQHRFLADLHHHQEALQSKKNLLPDLSKTRIVGVNLPVHETSAYTDIEFGVHLFDKDGEPSSGEHEVTVHITNVRENRSVALLAEPDEFDQGVYEVKYPLSGPGEYLLSVSVNYADLPVNCSFTVLTTARPDKDHSYVRAEERLVVNRVAEVYARVADKNGDTISGTLGVSASLQFERSHHLETLVSTDSDELAHVVRLLPRTPGPALLQVYVNGERFFSRAVTVEDQQDSSYTALTGAAEAGCVEFIVQLLALGFNVNEGNGTPLGVAAEGGRVRAVETLIENGAQVNTPGWLSETPLILAAKGGHASTVEALLKRGADANSKDILSQTPLMLAAKGGHVHSVAALLRSEANVNARDEGFQTALMMAAEGGHMLIVHRLHICGADVHAKNKYSETAFDLAVKNSFSEVATSLEEWTR